MHRHSNPTAFLLFTNITNRFFHSLTSCKKVWATSQENLSLGVCDQVRLKPACSATEGSQSLEILGLTSTCIGIILSKLANNKGPDQTAWMCRLICAVVVCVGHKAGFLMTLLIWVCLLVTWVLLSPNLSAVSAIILKGRQIQLFAMKCLPYREIFNLISLVSDCDLLSNQIRALRFNFL